MHKSGESSCVLQGALQQLVLRRCLSLVLLLDCAAQRQGVLNDSTPLLFRLSVKPKLESSAEVRRLASSIASVGVMAAIVMPSAAAWMCWLIRRSILGVAPAYSRNTAAASNQPA